MSGCTSSPNPNIETEPVEIVATILPSKFQLGDLVLPKGGERYGIVTDKFHQDLTWLYNVMFHDWTHQYNESELVLVKQFDWNAPVDPELNPESIDVPAEILSPIEFNEIGNGNDERILQ